MRTIYVGTSGWVYKEWAGAFYPKGCPRKREFEYYRGQFPTVEINATFYRLPTLKTVRNWHDQAPSDFVFAVKGSRYLTHIRRLKDTSRGLQRYFRRLAPLGEQTGPILWQLPPTFPKSDATMQRLDRFLRRLPRGYRHAVEFRHPSWMDEQTFTLLRRHRAACVWLSSQAMPADYTITADFVYLRFHGLEGGAYHDYTRAELLPWAKELTKAARQGLPAYVYFNNDLNTRAPLNAAMLMQMLDPHAVLPGSTTETIDHRRPSFARGPKVARMPRRRRVRPLAIRRRRRRRNSVGVPQYARTNPPVPAAG